MLLCALSLMQCLQLLHDRFAVGTSGDASQDTRRSSGSSPVREPVWHLPSSASRWRAAADGRLACLWAVARCRALLGREVDSLLGLQHARLELRVKLGEVGVPGGW